MKTTKHYLVIDIGTGNSRVGLISQDGVLIDVYTHENAYYMDDAYEDAQYFSPSYWKKCILPLCKKIIRKNPKIKIDAITSSGARESIVLFNQKGDDFYGLPNIDNRGRAWINEICNKKEIYEMTGRWVSEDFPAAKLLGLRKKRKDIYDEVTTFTSLSEWVAYLFTDIICIEHSQACETQLYDIEVNNWSEVLQKYYSVSTIMMPELKKSGTILSNITQDMKKYLQIEYDIPFIIGGADTQLAMLGANIKEGDIGIVSGTTSPIVTLMAKKFHDKKERCWTDVFLGGELYQVETNPGVTGLNYQRIRSLLFSNVSYDDLEAGLQEVKSIKCTASFSSLDFENARGYHAGGFFMPPPFRADLHRIDLAWAVVADIASSIYYQYCQLNDMVGITHTFVLGCGGGFQSKMLSQHIADLCNVPLKLPIGFAQSSILGCMKLCNINFGVSMDEGNEYIVYEPQEESLINEYYYLWKQNRDKING